MCHKKGWDIDVKITLMLHESNMIHHRANH